VIKPGKGCSISGTMGVQVFISPASRVPPFPEPLVIEGSKQVLLGQAARAPIAVAQQNCSRVGSKDRFTQSIS
jgi:hypothetical protein